MELYTSESCCSDTRLFMSKQTNYKYNPILQSGTHNSHLNHSLFSGSIDNIIMLSFTSQISILLLILFLPAITFQKCMSSNNHKVVRCNEKDRTLLLIFKQGIIDSFNSLSTWSSEEDCCAWKGVQCDNTTGRVTKLDLQPSTPVSDEEPLKTLEGEINLLSLLQLEFLNHLDLSNNLFDVIRIPKIGHNITLASNLHYLDLSWNDVIDMDNPKWLSQIPSLKYLSLSGINLPNETDWLQLVASLPSLLELRLSYCNLSNNIITPSLKDVMMNFTTSLQSLDLSWNSLHGEIPLSMWNLLRNLIDLNLSRNQLSGSIPFWIGQLEQLSYLDLSDNEFRGFIPSTLGNLSSLVELSIGSNYLTGTISESLFSKLFKLEYLDLSNSNFVFHFNPKWIPPFQLSWLSLSNTNQGPKFPSWIYTQKKLEFLDMSSSGISSVDGDMFLSFIVGIDGSVDLSNNSISQDLSNVTFKSSTLALDHNNFTGRLPNLLSSKAQFVDLSHNSFSGPIPWDLENFEYLQYLNLWSNRLSGEVPMDLSNLKQLQVLILEDNEFSGTLPIQMPQALMVLTLRSNRFEGKIPLQLFNLPHLFHLDLAHNKISGSMPLGIYNLTHMIMDNLRPSVSLYIILSKINLYTKGQDYDYQINLKRRTIDLSANKLSGEIPLELFRLVKVQTLNLSNNHLTGKIQNAIGDMKELESLDLSNNQLYGEIPQSMAGLTFLGYLNLSFNNFSGQIPTSGTQLQSFDASSYIGNPKLCGAPLPKCISIDNPEKAAHHARYEDGDPKIESVYLAMGVGFAVGFCGSCGSLFFNKRWRHAFFRFLNQVADQIYVALMVKLNRFNKTHTSIS